MKRYVGLSATILFVLAAIVIFLPVRAHASDGTHWAASAPRAPAIAAAAVYSVNTNSDLVLTAGCTGAAGQCSLRGAVQLANLANLGPSTVEVYVGPSLNGMTITLGSTLVITGGYIWILGQDAVHTLIAAPSNQPAFLVSSDYNIIEYLAVIGGITGHGAAQDGIRIAGSSNEFNHTALYALGGSGLVIESSAGLNSAFQNLIGVGNGLAGGGCGAGNAMDGILINGSSNQVTGNTVGCNGLDGVALAGNTASGNELTGNYIGVTALGAAIPNTFAGVSLYNAAINNRVGKGNAPKNIISGNGANGVYISDAGTSSNTVRNNYIGLSPVGTFPVANHLNGVWIAGAADSNVIGGHVLTEANAIAGNAASGIVLNGIGASDATDTRYNLVIGNRIGLNAAGAAVVPNGGSGMLVQNGAWANVIGDGDDADRNTITGNAGDGISVLGAKSNTIEDNNLGVNISLTVAISNGQNAVRLDNGAVFNLVTSNYIANSRANGIVISGAGSTTNTLSLNIVGGNSASGVALLQGTQGNLIASNTIEPNPGDGILLDGAGTSNNLITDTVVSFSAGTGIRERNGAAGNVWSHTRTTHSHGLGIDTGATGPTAPYPVITSVSASAGSVTVKGTASAAILEFVQVELYRVSTNPSGLGEGGVYLGSTYADINGNWSITYTGSDGCFTAFQTETLVFFSTSSSSSEFGPNSCRQLLPLVER